MELQVPSFPILLSFFLFVFVVIKILIKGAKTGNSASKLPPGPWKLPFVGNIHQLFGSLLHHKLRDLAKKHGPFMYLRIGQVPTIVVSSPEFAEEVMITHGTIFASRPRVLFPEIMAYGCTDIVFAPYGEYWRQLRKICTQELLSTARVHSFKPIREEELFNLMDWIASNVGSVINLTERIQTSMYGVISRAAFGKKSRDHDEFVSIVVEAVEVSIGFELADFFPSFGFLAKISPARPKLERLQRRAARIIENIIKDHKENKSSEKSGASGTDEDLLDVLLKYHNKSDHGISLTGDNLKAVIW
ncbi:Cytochrome P450, E-class, group I, partial [Trema orientale]